MLLILIKKKGVKYERLKMDAYFWLNLCDRFHKFGFIYFTSLGDWGFAMIRAIYFALCFACSFLGLIIAIHIDTTIGLSMFALFIVKFLLMLPKYES